MSRGLALLVLLPALGAMACGGVALPTHATRAAFASVADPRFLEQYAATWRFRLGEPTGVTVTPDGDEVLFLRSGPRSFVHDLYAFNTETGEERVLVTTAQMLGTAHEELSDEERGRRERLRLAASGIASYELSTDGRLILVPLSGRLFLVERASGAVRQLDLGAAYANDPHFSPDASRVACVRDGDLYVVDVGTGRQRRLTSTASGTLTNALPEFIAQEEMGRYRGYWWSPDGAQIAYQQTDTSDVERLHITDPMHPERPARSAPYPRAGRANARVRLGVVSVATGRTRWVQWDEGSFPYLAAVTWAAGAPLTLVVQSRRQTEEHVLAVDRQGATRDLLVERDSAWVNLDRHMPRYLPGGGRFLWSSERAGAWQLEVRSADGRLERVVVPAGFGFRGLVHVDLDGSTVWFRGGVEPTETHLFRVSIDADGDAGAPVQLTRSPGLHDAVVRGPVRVMQSQIEADVAADAQVRTVFRDGEAIGSLRSTAEAPPFMPRMERVTVGSRDYRAVVIRPRNFDPARRYPVLVSVYGGPHHSTVAAASMRYLMQQWYADHGFIVVSADGRGTPARGRDWERSISGNFIDVPLADQAEALTALGARFLEMDLSRVGIYGWSFGGYFAAMAVMQRPGLFHVAVAGAPVADWADYDTHYTERYMGLPAENQAGYRESSLLTFAPELTRPLLLVHGTADDNVYFTHAIKLSDALFRAGRPHVFLPLSGFTHMVAEPEVTRSLHERIVRFFAERL